MTDPAAEIQIATRQATVRGLLVLALPLILGAAAQSLIHFTDRLFIARLGLTATAAAFAAGMTAFTCQCLFIAAAGFTVTLASQHRGAGERMAVGPAVWPGIWIAAAGGVVCALLIPLTGSLFRLLEDDPAIRQGLVTLTDWFLLCAAPGAVLAAIGGHFAGTGRTRVVMALNLALLAINAALQWALIFGNLGLPALGLWGSGMGSFLANAVVAGVALVLFLRPAERREWNTGAGWRCDWRRLAGFCRFAVPQAGRLFCEMVAWTAFVFVVGSCGAASLAANNLLLTWNLVAMMPMAGLSQAIAVAVGTASGAGRPDLARRAFLRCLGLMGGYGMAVATCFVAGGGLLMAPFLVDSPGLTSAEVARVAWQMLPVCALYVLADAVNLSYSGALSGAGDTRFQMLATLATVVPCLVLPVWAVMWIGPAWWRGHGIEPAAVLWAVSMLWIAVLMAILAWRWHRGGWEGHSAAMRAGVGDQPPSGR
jgi:MATE family multidrug resistance protein